MPIDALNPHCSSPVNRKVLGLSLGVEPTKGRPDWAAFPSADVMLLSVLDQDAEPAGVDLNGSRLRSGYTVEDLAFALGVQLAGE